MARGEPPVAGLGRRGREVHELLGDEQLGLRLDQPRLVGELLGTRLRADEHALAAGLRGRLDDDLVQASENPARTLSSLSR